MPHELEATYGPQLMQMLPHERRELLRDAAPILQRLAAMAGNNDPVGFVRDGMLQALARKQQPTATVADDYVYPEFDDEPQCEEW